MSVRPDDARTLRCASQEPHQIGPRERDGQVVAPAVLTLTGQMSDRVVVVGDPNSIFVQTPVSYWRGLGVDAVILTSRWSGPASVANDLPVFTAEALAPESVKRAAAGLVPFLDAVNTATLGFDPARVQRALRTWQHTAVPPSITPPLYDGLLIAAAADVLEPACVFGHEAFAYGLATCLSRARRRALFVWGADVLQFAAMTDPARALVHQALHGVSSVLTTAGSMAEALQERFALPPERIALISYGVDRHQFRRATPERDARVRDRYRIAPGSRVVMNIRRFRPHWGSAIAWPAMLAVAERHPEVHLVLIGGSRTDADLDRTIAEAAARHVSRRLTVVRGNVPLDEIADLMSVAEVSLSLVEPLEPVSWSVLQASACDSVVIVGDQPTYRTECARGLSAVLVPPCDVTAVTGAIDALLQDHDRRQRMCAANDRYLSAYQDQHTEMIRLLRVVAGSNTAERLLEPAAR
jgi:hypothetical protein